MGLGEGPSVVIALGATELDGPFAGGIEVEVGLSTNTVPPVLQAQAGAKFTLSVVPSALMTAVHRFTG